MAGRIPDGNITSKFAFLRKLSSTNIAETQFNSNPDSTDSALVRGKFST